MKMGHGFSKFGFHLFDASAAMSFIRIKKMPALGSFGDAAGFEKVLRTLTAIGY